MTVLTGAEDTLLRTYPQQTSLYLSIFQPTIALMCQVSGTYSSDNQTVGFDNTTSGSIGNIADNVMQVALIGTTPGSDDRGRTWVRSAIAGSLRFLESDHIDWTDNLYITVLKYTEIIPIFPHIIEDPANEENVIFYKIWDVAYANQNTILGNILNMGSHYAGWTGDTVYWSLSGTLNLNGDVMDAKTALWEFEGGNPTGSVLFSPGDVTYSSPGHYRTKVTLTDADGETETSFRYVSIYDKPGEGSRPPIINWSLVELSGSVDGSGWTCRVRIRQEVPKGTVIDNALVVIFSDDWYGGTNQSLPTNDVGRNHIKFVGYIDGDTIQQNYIDNYVDFSAISPAKIMELCECFSVSVEAKKAPTTWYELKDMTVKKAIYHYLRWHSTVLMCSDVHLDFNDRNIQYFDSDRTSLYDAINSLMSGSMLGRVVSDRIGGTWAYREPCVLSDPTGTIPVMMSLSNIDWIGEPVIDERMNEEVSFIEMGGIAFYTTFYESTPLLAAAPGVAPSYHGTVERPQGLALEDQNELNQLIGDWYAFKNARFPSNEFKLRMNAQHLDIAPPSQVKVTMAANDNRRQYVWTGKPFYITAINEIWNDVGQIIIQSVSLHELTTGYDGDTVIISVEPPEPENPGEEPPKPPNPPVWPPVPPPSAAGAALAAVVSVTADIEVTQNITAASPAWITEL